MIYSSVAASKPLTNWDVKDVKDVKENYSVKVFSVWLKAQEKKISKSNCFYTSSVVRLKCVLVGANDA